MRTKRPKVHSRSRRLKIHSPEIQGENKWPRKGTKNAKKRQRRISGKADFAQSPPLATSARDAKAQRQNEDWNSRKRAQRGKAATKSWQNAVTLDKSGV